MAKVTIEFKRNFAKRVDNKVMEGITTDIHIEFQDDQDTPAGALALIMASDRKEFIRLAMNKLVQKMQAMGDDAQGEIYQPTSSKH